MQLINAKNTETTGCGKEFCKNFKFELQYAQIRIRPGEWDALYVILR